jgi:ferritin-like metal-binding protein YciE
MSTANRPARNDGTPLRCLVQNGISHTGFCSVLPERPRERFVLASSHICRHEDTMATKTLNDLLLLFMQDVYYAERQILKALPKMAKATQNAELKDALMHHREETQGQVERLQKAFEALGKRARGQTCEAINGIIEEGEEVIEEMPEGAVRDAGIVASAQAVEHYEMARYGTIIAWAKAVGAEDVAKLMHETLEEEKKADTLLNDLARRGINQQAIKQAA